VDTPLTLLPSFTAFTVCLGFAKSWNSDDNHYRYRVIRDFRKISLPLTYVQIFLPHYSLCVKHSWRCVVVTSSRRRLVGVPLPSPVFRCELLPFDRDCERYKRPSSESEPPFTVIPSFLYSVIWHWHSVAASLSTEVAYRIHLFFLHHEWKRMSTSMFCDYGSPDLKMPWHLEVWGTVVTSG